MWVQHTFLLRGTIPVSLMLSRNSLLCACRVVSYRHSGFLRRSPGLAASHLSALSLWPAGTGPSHSCCWQGRPDSPLVPADGVPPCSHPAARHVEGVCFPVVLTAPLALAPVARASSLAFWSPCLQGELLSFYPSLKCFSLS